MTNDEYPSGLATQKRSDKTFAKRIADRITVGHLLAAGVLAGFGAGFGSHALVGMLGNQDQPAEHCNHAPVISDDHSTGYPALGVYVDTSRKHRRHGGCHHRHHRSGLAIDRVVHDSPADDAGLEAGDVIVQINGRTIDSSRQLHRALRRHEVGDRVSLHVHRDGERVELETKLGDFGTVHRSKRRVTGT